MQFAHITKKLQGLLGDLYTPVMMAAKVVGIIMLTIIAVRLGSFIIRKIFQKQRTFKYKISDKRIDTIETLLISFVRYGIYLIAVVTILTDVFKLKTIIAAAGIGGVAIGFGAQSLVRDFISGFFIILENQFVVGDSVTIDSMTGTVENMELRATRLRNFNGDLHIIPNGEIRKVTNHTRGDRAVIVDIPLSYSVDLNKAIETANAVCKSVSSVDTHMVEEPKVLGVTEFSKEGMNLRILAKAISSEQAELERQIRRMVKEAFSNEGIEFFDRNKIILKDSSLKGDNING